MTVFPGREKYFSASPINLGSITETLTKPFHNPQSPRAAALPAALYAQVLSRKCLKSDRMSNFIGFADTFCRGCPKSARMTTQAKCRGLLHLRFTPFGSIPAIRITLWRRQAYQDKAPLIERHSGGRSLLLLPPIPIIAAAAPVDDVGKPEPAYVTQACPSDGDSLWAACLSAGYHQNGIIHRLFTAVTSSIIEIAVAPAIHHRSPIHGNAQE